MKKKKKFVTMNQTKYNIKISHCKKKKSNKQIPSHVNDRYIGRWMEYTVKKVLFWNIYIMIYSVYCLQVFDITISEKLMRFPYSFCCYLSIMTFMYKLELLRPEYRWPMSFIH